MMTNKKTVLAFFCCTFLYFGLLQGQVSAGSLLGLPRATTVEMNAVVSPQIGALVYNTDDDKVYRFTSTGWLANTDDQLITDFNLDDTNRQLTISLEDGGTETVDFTTVLAAAGTDDQEATEVNLTVPLDIDGDSNDELTVEGAINALNDRVEWRPVITADGDNAIENALLADTYNRYVYFTEKGQLAITNDNTLPNFGAGGDPGLVTANDKTGAVPTGFYTELLNATGNANVEMNGAYLDLKYQGTGNASSMRAVMPYVIAEQGSGDIGKMVSSDGVFLVRDGFSGNITNAKVYDANALVGNNAPGSSVENMYGVHVRGSAFTSPNPNIDSKYGLKIENVVPSATGANTEVYSIHTGLGQHRFGGYGTGTHTGTPTGLLGVEADGNVIEVDASTLDTNTTNVSLTEDGTNIILTDSDGATVTLALADIAAATNTNTTNASLTEDGTNLILTDSDGATVTLPLADIVGTVENLYTADGTLTGNRTVTQDANTLAFTGTAVNAFSVDGTTFSVDAENDRVGIGTATPETSFHVATPAGGNFLFSGENSAVLQMREDDSANSWYVISDGTDFNIREDDTSNGNTRFAIQDGGNVGIGTTAPARKLEVRAPAGEAIIRVGGPGLTEGTIEFGNANHGVKRNYNAVANDVGLFTSSGNIHLSTNNNAGDSTGEFILTDGGNVGIGSAAPSVKLDVAGVVKVGSGNTVDGQGLQMVWNNGAIVGAGSQGMSSFLNHRGLGPGGFTWSQTNDNLNFIEFMRLSSGGRLGLNTNAPTARLDVNGNARVRNIVAGDAADAVVTTDADGNLRQRTAAEIVAAGGGNIDTNTTNVSLTEDGTNIILTDSDGGTVTLALADIAAATDTNTTNASLTEDGTNLILTDSDGATVTLPLADIVGTVENLYTVDGTLTGNRTVNTAGSNLDIIVNNDATNALNISGGRLSFRNEAVDGNITTLANTNFLANSNSSPTGPNTDTFGDGNFVWGVGANTIAGAQERMRLTQVGRLGIATAAPSARLDVNGNARIRNIAAGDATDGIVTTDANGNLRQRTAAEIVAAGGGATDNIYTADGTLTGNRTVTLNDNDLIFESTGGTFVSIDGTSGALATGGLNLGQGNPNATNPAGLSFYSDKTDASGTSNWEARIIKQPGIDNNLNIINAGSGQIDFRVNGNGIPLLGASAIAMSILANTDVGIGTNAPTARLDVNGNARVRTLPAGAATDGIVTTDADGNLRQRTLAEVAGAGADGDAWGVTGEDTAGAISRTGDVTLTNTSKTALTLQTADNALTNGLAFQNSGGNYSWNIFREPNATDNADGELVFAGGANATSIDGLTERMRLDSNGNLGLGTSDPQHLLDLGNDLGRKLSFFDNGALFFGMGLDTGRLNFFSAAGPTDGPDMTLYHDSGNVRLGIGTDTPTNTLSVAGGISTANAIELGELGTGDRNSFIDFHAEDGVDRNFRIRRFPGADGVVQLQNSGTGAIQFLTDFGQTAMTVNSSANSNNVGIGIVNAEAKLDVNGTARIRDIAAGDATDAIVTTDANGNIRKRTLAEVAGAGADGDAWGVTGEDLASDVGRTGNVGIGTVAPAVKLQVAPTTTYGAGVTAPETLMRLQSPVIANVKFATTADFKLGDLNPSGTQTRAQLDIALSNGSTNQANNTIMTLLGNNRVGIGTTTPTDALQLNGGFRLGLVNPIGSANLTESAGDRLYFSGAGANAAVDSENTDPIWISRYNTDVDNSELRVSVGDALANNADGLNVGLLAGGTWRSSMFVNTAQQRVGIATSAPSARLDVNGNARVRTLPAGAGSDAVVTTDADGNLRQRTAAQIVAEGGGVTSTDGDAWGVTGEDVASSISRTGDVTLTNTSKTALTLQTADNALTNGLAFQNSGGNYSWNIFREPNATDNADGELVFAGGANATSIDGLTERMRLDNNGNLGIGTNNPTHKLQVMGTDPIIAVGEASGQRGGIHFGNLRHGVKRDYNGIGNDVGLYTTSADLHLSTNDESTGQFILTNAGDIGIGTATPSEKLDVNGEAVFRGGSGGSIGNAGYGPAGDQISLSFNGSSDFRHVVRSRHSASNPNGNSIDFILWNQATDMIGADPTARVMTLATRAGGAPAVGIGAAEFNPTQLLDVRGGNISVTGGSFIDDGTTITAPDYVFEKYFNGSSALKEEYSFTTLETIEQFVKEHKHLPGIKSAYDIQKEGWDLSFATRFNLEKAEELFLHTIEQEKAIKQLEAENEALKDRLDAIEKMLLENK